MNNILHFLFLLLLVGPWIILGYVWWRQRSVAKTRAEWNWALIVNTSMLYALTFNVIFFIQELFLTLGKKWLGLTAYLYHNNHSWEGSHPMTDLAQAYGAVAIFIAGALCLTILLFYRTSSHTFKYFLFWMAFHGLVQSLPQLASGILAPETDVGLAMAYLQWSEELKLVVSGLGLVLLAMSCILLGRMFDLSTSISVPVQSKMRNIVQYALIPSVIGIVLIIPFRIMPWHQIISPVIVTLAGVPWLLVGGALSSSTDWKTNGIMSRTNSYLLVALILLLVLFQWVLAPGVRFDP